MAADSTYPVSVEGELDPELGRWLWLVKWLLAIPHYLVVSLLQGGGGQPGAGLITMLAVFGAVGMLFNGRYPRDIFDLVLGFNRWGIRVTAYAALMTDKYPPFRLAP